VGTPVLAADLPPLQELVTKSGGGRTTATEPQALADSIADLLSRPDELVALGAAGRRYWQRELTPPSVAAQIVDSYEAARAARGLACAA
jgi:glycosyltransferase involved in cell wall biosynthesis